MKADWGVSAHKYLFNAEFSICMIPQVIWMYQFVRTKAVRHAIVTQTHTLYTHFQCIMNSSCAQVLGKRIECAKIHVLGQNSLPLRVEFSPRTMNNNKERFPVRKPLLSLDWFLTRNRFWAILFGNRHLHTRWHRWHDMNIRWRPLNRIGLYLLFHISHR